MAKLAILDVGHGNCSILYNAKTAVLIDVGPPGHGHTVTMAFLQQLGITNISDLIISHADADHLGAGSTLLLNDKLSINRVYLNADSTKQTRPDSVWEVFRSSITTARLRSGTKVITGIHTDSPRIELDDISIRVVAPSPEDTLAGPGTMGAQGRRSSNSLSAVIFLQRGDLSLACIPGDMEASTLTTLEKLHTAIHADILVFPHHGGRPGNANPADFARRVCSFVSPHRVIFSMARNGGSPNPRPEIVRAVRSTLPASWINCTQLSRHCAERVPDALPRHLSGAPSAGVPSHSCCAGSIIINLDDIASDGMPQKDSHLGFITAHAPNHICIST